MYSNLNIYNETYRLRNHNQDGKSDNVVETNFNVARPLPSRNSYEKEFLDLHVILFIDLSGKCQYSNNTIKMLKNNFSSIDDVFIVKDINNKDNVDLLGKYNGEGIPFFFSLVTNNHVLGGNYQIDEILNSLKEVKEQFSSVKNDIKNLKVNLYVMEGCIYCVKLKELFEQYNVLEDITVVSDLENHKQDLKNVNGFPHLKSQTTGKSMTGYTDNLENIIKELK